MFDVLTRVDRRVAEEALYHAGLRIREREHFREWRHWLPLRTSGVLARESLDVAAAVLEEIERRSGKPLGDLPDEELAPYRQVMDEIEDRRWREAMGPDDGAGRRLLEELRREYGSPSQRAA